MAREAGKAGPDSQFIVAEHSFRLNLRHGLAVLGCTERNGNHPQSVVSSAMDLILCRTHEI